jgi:hypothetical protein
MTLTAENTAQYSATMSMALTAHETQIGPDSESMVMGVFSPVVGWSPLSVTVGCIAIE